MGSRIQDRVNLKRYNSKLLKSPAQKLNRSDLIGKWTSWHKCLSGAARCGNIIFTLKEKVSKCTLCSSLIFTKALFQEYLVPSAGCTRVKATEPGLQPPWPLGLPVQSSSSCQQLPIGLSYSSNSCFTKKTKAIRFSLLLVPHPQSSIYSTHILFSSDNGKSVILYKIMKCGLDLICSHSHDFVPCVIP